MPCAYVAGVGAANVDIHVRSRAPLNLHDSNPGSCRLSAGGVTRNILENLSRLGIATRLVSALGEDLFGQWLLEHCAGLRMDTDAVKRIPGEGTSSYTALMDAQGDMFAAISDMSVLQRLTPESLKDSVPLLSGAALIVCDPCLPEETLCWLCDSFSKTVPLACDPVSTAYAKRLADIVGCFSLVKPNRMELEILSGVPAEDDVGVERAAESLLQKGSGAVLVSLGSSGCYWADREGRRFFASLSPEGNMADATGAGDACLAGAIYGLLMNAGPETAVRYALAAGKIAVRSFGACSRELSPELLKAIAEE